MQPLSHSDVLQTRPPIAEQTCFSSAPVMLNQGTRLGSEQAGVLSSVVPGGALVQKPSPAPEELALADGRLASYSYIQSAAPTFTTFGFT